MRSLLVVVTLLVACGSESAPTDLAARFEVSPDELAALMAQRGLTRGEIAALPAHWVQRAARKLRASEPGHPDAAEEFRLQSLRSADGTIPHNADQRGKAQMRALMTEGVAGGLDSARWTDLGPGNIGGRMRAIAIHPANPSLIFVGSVAGGIWKSLDAGASWQPVDDLMTNLSITTIVFQPGNPTVMYAATGEGFRNADAVRGAGVFKSTDGGLSWSQLPSTNNPNFYYVTRLSISADAFSILVSTRTGIYRSQDAGATWTRVLGSPAAFCLDVKFHPQFASVAVAHIGDNLGGSLISTVAYTTDGGANWLYSTGIATVGAITTRIELAWHRGWLGTGNGCVYAMKDQNSTLFRSLDGGANWTQVSTSSILGSQGWYDNALWVDPSDRDANPADDVLIAGGIDLWRSSNGGTSWSRISQWAQWPRSAHADHHMIVEHPQFDGVNNRTVYFGNDGGIWRADNVYGVSGTNGWINLNNGLRITQFYGGSRHDGAGILIGGTQDNGTLRRDESSGQNGWTTMFGGDGGFCASNANDSNFHYGEYVYLQIHRSTDGGMTSNWIDSGIGDAGTGTTANFIAPFVLDPNDQNTLLGGGASLWRSVDATAARPTWAAIKPAVGSNISAIAVQSGNPVEIWVGHNNGDVFVTYDGRGATPAWVKVDEAQTWLPDRKVMRITLDPTNRNRVFVSFAGYAADNLWESTDGAASWVAKPGMPAVPVRDLEIHPGRGNYLYAGTEVGLLVSENGGTTWTSTATPAFASIDELLWHGSELYMITHARGMFRQRVIAAGSVNRGVPCTWNGGAAGPTLRAPLPIAGTRVTLAASNGPASGAGVLYLSMVPAAPLQISPGCFVQLDLTTMGAIAPLAFSAAGLASLPIDLPAYPGIMGRRLMLQVVALAGSGIQFSNGQELMVGQ